MHEFYFQILACGVLLGSTLLLSKLLGLSLEKNITVSAIRTIVQLSALGLILHWVFESSSGLVLLLIFTVMTLFATQTVVARSAISSLRAWLFAASVLIVGVWPVGLITLPVFFGLGAFTKASVAIPFLGLVLGNSLTAVSLAFQHSVKQVEQGREERDCWLALGATKWQSAKRQRNEILHTALTPILNSMSVVGVVSLPGLMAGQALAGADIRNAAYLQICIMIILLCSSFFGALASVTLPFEYFSRYSTRINEAS